MMKALDLTGKKFGRWEAIRPAKPNGKGHKKWICRCECGIEKPISVYTLTNGDSKSCGCLRIDKTIERSTRHGHATRKGQSKEYVAWWSMKKRVESENSRQYKDYGGRGISIHPRYQDFKNFLEDLGPAPSPEHSIDRINNDGNYDPGNLQWSTYEEQQNNTRQNRRITHDGKTMTVSQWAKATGIPKQILYSRLHNGWSDERALSTPVLSPNEHPDCQMLEFDGKSMCIADWARAIKVPYHILHSRISQGWSVEKALTTPVRPSNRLIEFDGRTMSLAEWSRETGIPYGTLKSRLRYGWSAEKALTEAVKK